MKVYYDKWGKYGHTENFKVENSETLKFGGNIFYGQFFNFEKYTWSFPLDKLESVEKMFSGCTALGEFNSDLPKLKNGDGMFWGCSNLKTFNTNLSSLEDGREMFRGCSSFTTFTSDLSSLTDGYFMFQLCSKIKSFSSNLGSLKSGYWMFSNCSKLTSFTSNLSNLLSGYWMFESCELNTESLRNIADTINDISDLDKSNNEDWTYEVLGETKTIDDFYRGRIDIGHDESISQDVLLTCGNKLIDKGWDVYFNRKNYKPVWVEFNDYGELKNADLSGLVDGTHMFMYTNVGQITNENGTVQSVTFDYDLSSLTNGYMMFHACSNLTSFSSKLGSLKSGYNMFGYCKLDAESLNYIANNINNLVEKGYNKDIDEHWTYELLGETKTIDKYWRGRIDIGHTDTMDQEILDYCGSLLNSKGWTVYFNGNEFKK